MSFLISKAVSDFLVTRMKQENLTRKALSERSSLPYHKINRLINEKQPHTSMNVLLTLADAYHVSIGTILGQEDKQNVNSVVSAKEMQKNLKQFIVKKLNTKQEKPRKLATTIGFNEGAVTSFLAEPPKTQFLGIPIVLALSKHWGVSIDEMIGRTTPTQSITQQQEKNPNVPLDHSKKN